MNIFILLITLIITVKCISAQSTINEECFVVNELLQKNQTYNCCQEEGVTCSNDGHITKINISGKTHSVSIPPEIGNLINLKYLYFGKSKINGSIPPELGNLSNLEYLCLAHNKLSDSIPPELGNLINLEYLNFRDNRLSGSIPPELAKLSKLKTLDLSSNNLTGSIPPELAKIPKLNTLQLSINNLSGFVPKEIQKSNIKLYIANNPLLETKSTNIKLIIIICLVIPCVLFIALSTFYVYLKNKRRNSNNENDESSNMSSTVSSQQYKTNNNNNNEICSDIVIKPNN
ncbi:L domain-like protein [Piromyces finnis]|uniref:L domain-like protein n=1 Tax=Piromyces finnis TaxID=1754191 RepID=A0A1Y1VMJ1_9FUNG|nr:L domain-like protein [Piromyces finnis]|eukprot:ORX59366.1 L domain-like protein [Piromyces finnis]